MVEFTLGPHSYSIGKLDAFKQFHLSRKVAPIIPTLIPVFLKLNESAPAGSPGPAAEGAALRPELGALAELLTPFTLGIASMPDEAAEFILATCLGAVQRKQGKGWVPVWSATQNVCMFDDLDVGVMVQLALRVIRESLGPFLRGMLSGQSIPTG